MKKEEARKQIESLSAQIEHHNYQLKDYQKHLKAFPGN